MLQDKWIEFAIELQSLAQAGLTYGKDVYDKERYTRIREIAAEMKIWSKSIFIPMNPGRFWNIVIL